MSNKLSEKTEFADLLRKSGLKATPGRIDLLMALRENMKPLNIESIHRILNRKIDLATVYRNVILLEKIGIIKRVDLKQRGSLFELSDDQNHHHHISCLKCGLTEDFSNCKALQLAKSALAQSKQFSEIRDHSVELFGVCKKCE